MCVNRRKTGYVLVHAENLNFFAHVYDSMSDFTAFQKMLFVALQL